MDITPGLLRQLGRDYRCRPYNSRQSVYEEKDDDPPYLEHSPTEESFTIRRLIDRNRTLENELAAARRDASQLSWQWSQAEQNQRRKASTLQIALQELQVTFKEASARLDELRESKAVLAKELDTQRSETKNITQEKKRLEARLVSKESSLSETLVQLEEERVRSRHEAQQSTVCLTAKEAALKDYRAQLDLAQQKNSALAAQLEMAHQQNSALVERNADLEAAVISLKGSISACWLHRFWAWVALLRALCTRSVIRFRNALTYR